MHQSHFPQCTICNRNVHIFVTKWCIVGNCQTHRGIYEMGLFHLPAPTRTAEKWPKIQIYFCFSNTAYRIQNQLFLGLRGKHQSCMWLTCHLWGPLYKHKITLIPARISNHMPSKVWDEITYPFSQTSMAAAFTVWEWMSDFISH